MVRQIPCGRCERVHFAQLTDCCALGMSTGCGAVSGSMCAGGCLTGVTCVVAGRFCCCGLRGAIVNPRSDGCTYVTVRLAPVVGCCSVAVGAGCVAVLAGAVSAVAGGCFGMSVAGSEVSMSSGFLGGWADSTSGSDPSSSKVA